ncbi:thiamine diphosphokinase [Jeotgalibacillus marinus]|uniref:Thiamine diphosphokinase n=1 Tax=Jeotgalibacillus marinus TaxID=86667 RepID=A0ABV3Q328_9BACL
MIYLVGGGALNVEWLKKLDKDDVTWIGVDRGTKSIMDADLIVDRAFGDFDSVTEEELTAIKRSVKYIEKASPDKDQTDMEMALDWALDQQQPIRMVGATGGRLDHFFGNVQLLASKQVLSSIHEVEIMDEQNRIRCLDAGEWEAKKDLQFPYVSFIPLTPCVEKLSLDGVKYPLNNKDLFFGSTLTISNEIIYPIASISFSAGILMMVRSKDN